MKNLSNVKPSEFFPQAAKMSHAVEAWIQAIDFEGLKKKHIVKPVDIREDMTKEEKVAEYVRHKQEVATEGRKLALDVINAMFAKYPKETGELLALSCFVEPEDLDKHTMGEYLMAVSEMLTDESVTAFFTSLAQSGLLSLLKA